MPICWCEVCAPIVYCYNSRSSCYITDLTITFANWYWQKHVYSRVAAAIDKIVVIPLGNAKFQSAYEVRAQSVQTKYIITNIIIPLYTYGKFILLKKCLFFNIMLKIMHWIVNMVCFTKLCTAPTITTLKDKALPLLNLFLDCMLKFRATRLPV